MINLIMLTRQWLMIHTNPSKKLLMMMMTLHLNLTFEVTVVGLMLVCGSVNVMGPLDLHTLIKKCGGVGQILSNRRPLLNTSSKSALARMSPLALQPRGQRQQTSREVHLQLLSSSPATKARREFIRTPRGLRKCTVPLRTLGPD
jgi:hypothetical protein